MSVQFPLLIEDKVDHPDRLIALQNILSKYYSTAAEINLKRDAINELYDFYTFLKQNQITSVKVVKLIADIPTNPGDPSTSYKVVKEPVATDNGYYHYETGVGVVKDISDTTETSDRIAADTTLQNNIDAEASARASADTTLQAELDATQSGAGLEADGSYAADNTTIRIKTATSLKDADKKLDAQIKINEDNIATNKQDIATEASARSSADTAEASARASADTTLQAELDATQSGAGLDADGSWVPPVGAGVVDGTVSIKDAINELDQQVSSNANNIAQEISDRLTTDNTLFIDADNIIKANVSLFEERIIWHTGDSTSITLAFTPTDIINIFINGSKLYDASQYTVTLPNIINILSALADTDVITIQYEHLIN